MSPSQILTILRRRLWILAITLASTLVGAGLLMMLLPSRFDAVTTATIDPGQADPVTGTAANALAIRYIQGNMVALATSRRVALEVVRRLNLTSNPNYVSDYRASKAFGRTDFAEWIANELLERVDAKFNEGANVLILTAKSNEGPLAALLANTFMSAFVDAAIEMKVTGAQQTAQWFAPQTRELVAEVEDLRNRLTLFQREAKLAPISSSDSEVTLLNQITTELSNAKAETVRISSQLEEAKAAKAAGADTNGQSFDTQLLQSLKSTLASNLAELSRMQAALGARNPKVVQLEAAQKSIRAQIEAEIDSARATLETKLASVRGQVAELEKARLAQVQRMIEIQSQRDRMLELSRELEVKQERLNLASRQASAAQLQGRLSFSNITVLDRAAAPASPAFPKLIIIAPLAFAAGLGLGVFLSLIVEALDRRIRMPSDLEFAVRERCLGQLLPSATSNPRSLRQRLPRPTALKGFLKPAE